MGTPWIWFALAAAVGFALGWLVMALRAARAQQQLGLELENARTRLKSQEMLDKERDQALERAQERLTVAFDGLARATLRSNSELFLKLAHENLGQQQLQATHALKEREQAIEALLRPVQEALGRTQAQIASIEKDRHEAFGAMRQSWNRSIAPSRPCSARRAISSMRCAGPKCAASGERCRCDALWNWPE